MPNLRNRLASLATQISGAHETISLVIPSHSLVDDAVAYAVGETPYQRIEKAIVRLENEFGEKAPLNLPLLNASLHLVAATDLVKRYQQKQQIDQPVAEIERRFQDCERQITESLERIKSLRTELDQSAGES